MGAAPPPTLERQVPDVLPNSAVTRNTAARMFHRHRRVWFPCRHREGVPVTIQERCARRINLLDGFVANRSSQ
jgi:hypothetical protein